MTDIRAMNTIALAYMGDAVYETYVREHVMGLPWAGAGHADRLHAAGVSYVCAASQARAVKALLPMLTQEEAALVRRARNHKIATKPKNADAITYKWATAFEALLGFLYLSRQTERLDVLLKAAVDITENKDSATAETK